MKVQERFLLLLSSPDDGTFDAYDAPNIGHAFLIVTAYAIVSASASFLSAIIRSDNFGFSFIAFLGTFLLAYLTWAFLAILFHVVANAVGGLGELLNAIAYVGFAAAPMVVASLASILLTIIEAVVQPDDSNLLFAKIGLGISFIGMGWGWPGVLCYFGIKNGERLHEAKAAAMALIAFMAIGIFELSTSNLFQ